jgi:hypothetical protein
MPAASICIECASICIEFASICIECASMCIRKDYMPDASAAQLRLLAQALPGYVPDVASEYSRLLSH